MQNLTLCHPDTEDEALRKIMPAPPPKESAKISKKKNRTSLANGFGMLSG